MTSRPARIALYLLTLLFVGVGYVAILPPFEGFDETAYYSAIRQVADTGTIPIFGASFLDREAADYSGPMPYTSLNPPFDSGLVYSKFFAQPPLIESYRLSYRQSKDSHYRPSRHINWEAQHPPLYYLLMAPLERLLASSSFVFRIFSLRLASYLMALGGVALGLLAIRDSDAGKDASLLGFMAYPIALPMLFTEFTRIGNDSLCLLLAGAAAFFLSKWLKDESDRRFALALGITLGLGLLTKAFFIPIGIALAGFVIVRQFGRRASAAGRPGDWLNIFLIFAVAIWIGAGWYVYQMAAVGGVTGGADEIRVAQIGGLFAGLKEHLSSGAVVHGFAVTFVTYIWPGTWSLVRLPLLLYLPLLLLVAWCFAIFARRLRQLPAARPEWLCAWLFAVFALGVAYHVIVAIAAYGIGNTPGWYFHILMPWTAPALGFGVASILANRRTKPIVLGLLVYAVVFQIIAFWSQFALFTGCASKNDQKYYVFSGHVFCLDRVGDLLDRLSVLGWPGLAIAALSGGLVCAGLLLATAWRFRNFAADLPQA